MDGSANHVAAMLEDVIDRLKRSLQVQPTPSTAAAIPRKYSGGLLSLHELLYLKGSGRLTKDDVFATYIQSRVRGRIARQIFLRARMSSIRMQATWRGVLARREVHQLMVQIYAMNVIALHFRGWILRFRRRKALQQERDLRRDVVACRIGLRTKRDSSRRWLHTRGSQATVRDHQRQPDEVVTRWQLVRDNASRLVRSHKETSNTNAARGTCVVLSQWSQRGEDEARSHSV